jgi:hypothetical protein
MAMKKNKITGARGIAQVGECLPRKAQVKRSRGRQ